MNAVRWGLGHLGAKNYILAWLSEVSRVWFCVVLELCFIVVSEFRIFGLLDYELHCIDNIPIIQ